MTTTTIPPERTGHPRGFTLTEVIIGSTISSFVLAGVLSAVLLIGRSGANLANYSQMDTEARRALETVSQDVRMASDFSWNSFQSITLTVPDSYTGSGNKVTFAYDSSTTGSTARCFYILEGEATSTASRRILVRNVTELFFRRYDRLDNYTFSSLNTRRLVLALTVNTTGSTLVAANNHVVSASFILRNRPSI